MTKNQIQKHTEELSQHEAAGEILKRKRQKRSDANTMKPKGHVKRKKAIDDTEDVDNDRDDGGDDEEGSSDEEMLPSKQQRVHRRKTTFRSCSIIDDEDVDE